MKITKTYMGFATPYGKTLVRTPPNQSPNLSNRWNRRNLHESLPPPITGSMELIWTKRLAVIPFALATAALTLTILSTADMTVESLAFLKNGTDIGRGVPFAGLVIASFASALIILGLMCLVVYGTCDVTNDPLTRTMCATGALNAIAILLEIFLFICAVINFDRMYNRGGRDASWTCRTEAHRNDDHCVVFMRIYNQAYHREYMSVPDASSIGA
jgi:hypothetical protein